MELAKIKPYLLYDFNSEAELSSSILEMSQNFTKSRDKIGEYIMSERLVSAYTCFYLLTNIPKLLAAFQKIKIELEQFNDCEFIDIGAGPGTFSISLLEINPDLEISAIETSKAMIKQGQQIISGLYPKANHQYYDSIKKIPTKNKKRFGIFGHSANEMSTWEVQSYIKDLELDHILFIEPGTKDFFRHSLNIREKLLKNYTLNYPCICSSLCPMPEDDWCHQYLKIQHAADVERLTQLVKRDRRKLPIIINFYSKNELSNAQGTSRIIRDYGKTKFSFEWQVCQKRDGENKLLDVQVMTRPYKKNEIKNLGELLAGDEIKFDLDRELADNKVRGKLL